MFHRPGLLRPDTVHTVHTVTHTLWRILHTSLFVLRFFASSLFLHQEYTETRLGAYVEQDKRAQMDKERKERQAERRRRRAELAGGGLSDPRDAAQRRVRSPRPGFGAADGGGDPPQVAQRRARPSTAAMAASGRGPAGIDFRTHVAAGK